MNSSSIVQTKPQTKNRLVSGEYKVEYTERALVEQACPLDRPESTRPTFLLFSL